MPRIPRCGGHGHADANRAPARRIRIVVGEVVHQLFDPDGVLRRHLVLVEEPPDVRERGCVHVDRKSRERFLARPHEWVLARSCVRLIASGRPGALEGIGYSTWGSSGDTAHNAPTDTDRLAARHDAALVLSIASAAKHRSATSTATATSSAGTRGRGRGQGDDVVEGADRLTSALHINGWRFTSYGDRLGE